MAPTINNIMAGIENRLATISGLRTSDIVADQINPPQAIVGIPTIPNYHMTMRRGTFDINPTVTVLVSASLSTTGQHALAEYANPTGAKSIIAAIEGDKTLGGAVDDTILTEFRPLGLDEVGVVGYYGGVFTLRVLASGQ